MGWGRFTGTARRATEALVAVGLIATGMAMVAPTLPVGAVPTAPTAPPQEGAIPDISTMGWVPVLNEEFTGSTINTSIWDVSEGPGLNGPGMNTKDAVRIEPDPGQSGDGMLTLTTYSVDTNGAAAGGYQHFTGEVQAGGTNKTWTGFHAAYGYIEARVKLHEGPKTYSAFWMLSPNWHRGPWGDPAASGPEIDIFEIGDPVSGDLLDDSGAPDPDGDGHCDWQIVQLPCDQLAGGNQHWNGFDEDHAGFGNQVEWSGPSPQDNFINYGLLWTPDGYTMYRNGVQTYQSTEALTYNPEYIILDKFQGGGIAGTEPAAGYGDLATSPYKTTIDYVKVWQRPISDIPDRTVATNTPVAIPFSVTDYYSPSTSSTIGVSGKPRPEGVRLDVTANNNTGLVPNDRITFAGNEPTSNGTTTNPGFESGTTGWTRSGTPLPTTWPDKKHSGSNSIHLAQTGGRVEQTITGLRPNTTYQVGGFYNLELGYNDTHTRSPTGVVTPGGDGRFSWLGDSNSNGQVDLAELETLTEAGDLYAEVDMGIKDTDSSRTGDQEVRTTKSRNGWVDATQYWSTHKDAWPEQSLTFTTGNNTTQVTFFVDNTVKPGKDPNTDSDVSFDDLFVRPIVPPDRSVTLRPATDAAGSATITVAAWVDVNNNGIRTSSETLGTEAFTVTFTKGSTFTNGDFESAPVGTGWLLADNAPGAGAEIAVNTPFQLNRVLELGGPGWQPDTTKRAAGTVYQRVSGVEPNTTYTLTVNAKGTDLRFAYWGALIDGTHPDPCVPITNCQIISSTFTPKSIPFTTDSTGKGTVVILDWTPDAVSLVDNVTLTKTSPTSIPPLVSPALATLPAGYELRIPSSAPAAWNFSLPSAGGSTTVTSVKSNNQALIPDANLSWTAGAQHKVLNITPTLDRTGRATVTVGWNNAGVPTTTPITVIVSDNHLANPGFESADYWAGSTVATTGQRSGAGALQIDGTAGVTQQLLGMPDGTAYMLKGWVNGTVNVKVKSVPDASRWPASSFTSETQATWAGAGWTQNQLGFTTVPCQDCQARGSTHRNAGTTTIYAVDGGHLELTVTDANPSGASLVDDLELIRVPNASPIRELSLNQNMTKFAWDTRSTFDAGRIPAGAVSANGSLDPAVVSMTTTDQVPPPAGMGEVLPDANTLLSRLNPGRPYEWTVETHTSGPATQRTGRSTVAVNLTDPYTGLSTQRSATVTVNAGTLDNGDFQLSGARLGWADGWLNDSWQIMGKQSWPYMSSGCVVQPPDWAPCPNGGGATVGPSNADKVLRISSGLVGIKVSGLTPGVKYVIQGNAIGDGSSLKAVADDSAHSACTDQNPATACPFTYAATLLQWASTPATGPINSQTWSTTPNVFFTPRADDPATTYRNESDVWIVVEDADLAGGPVVLTNNDRPCARYLAATTCVDDIGVFKAADLGL